MSVFISNVDDFIAPSQACINPLVSSKISSQNVKEASQKVTIKLDTVDAQLKADAVKPNLIKMSEKKVATVSLNDCLACRYSCFIL